MDVGRRDSASGERRAPAAVVCSGVLSVVGVRPELELLAHRDAHDEEGFGAEDGGGGGGEDDAAWSASRVFLTSPISSSRNLCTSVSDSRALGGAAAFAEGACAGGSAGASRDGGACAGVEAPQNQPIASLVSLYLDEACVRVEDFATGSKLQEYREIGDGGR